MWNSSIFFLLAAVQCAEPMKSNLFPWGLCFTSTQLLQDHNVTIVPESLWLKGSPEKPRLSSEVPLIAQNCVWIGCVHLPVRAYRSCIWFQVAHVTKKEEESLTGALFSILSLFPSPGTSLLILQHKTPLFSNPSCHSYFCLFPSYRCWPSWTRSYSHCVHFLTICYSPTLGCPISFCRSCSLKMICAYLSHSPVTCFHSSPSVFSLVYGIIALDFVTFPSDCLIYGLLQDLFLWHLLSYCLPLFPLLPNGGLLQFSVTMPLSFCILFFGHLIQTHICAASTSLLKPRWVFINAISTQIPESPSTMCTGNSSYCLTAIPDFHISVNETATLCVQAQKIWVILDASFSPASHLPLHRRSSLIDLGSLAIDEANWPQKGPQCPFLLLSL